MSSPQTQQQTPTLNSLLQKRPSLGGSSNGSNGNNSNNGGGPGSHNVVIGGGDYVNPVINGGGLVVSDDAATPPSLAPNAGQYYAPAAATTSDAYFMQQQQRYVNAKFGQVCPPNGLSAKLALNSNHHVAPVTTGNGQQHQGYPHGGGAGGAKQHPTIAALRQEAGSAIMMPGGGRVSPGGGVVMTSAVSPTVGSTGSRGSTSPVSQMRHSPISPTPVSVYQNVSFQQNSDVQMPSTLYSSHQYNGPGQNNAFNDSYKYYPSPSSSSYAGDPMSYGGPYANGPASGAGGPGYPPIYQTRYRYPQNLAQQNGPVTNLPVAYGDDPSYYNNNIIINNNNNNVINNNKPAHHHSTKFSTNQNLRTSGAATTNGNSTTPLPPNLTDARLDSPTVSEESGARTPIGSDRQRTSGGGNVPNSRTKMNGSRESHPPTPAPTSPGGASSIHDDQDSSLSSPSWPRTPMSPASMRYQPMMGPPSLPMVQQGHGCPGPSSFMPSPCPSSSSSNVGGKETGLSLVQRLMGDYQQQQQATLSAQSQQATSPQEWSDRRQFFEQLVHFCETKGHPVTGQPTVSKTPVDLYKLYLSVKQNGGFEQVSKRKGWRQLCPDLGIPQSNSSSGQLKKLYAQYLSQYERFIDLGDSASCSSSTSPTIGAPPGGGQSGGFGPTAAESIGLQHPPPTPVTPCSSLPGGIDQSGASSISVPPIKQRKGKTPKFSSSQPQYPPDMAPPNLQQDSCAPVDYNNQQQQATPPQLTQQYPVSASAAVPQGRAPPPLGGASTSTRSSGTTEMVTNPFDDRVAPQSTGQTQHGMTYQSYGNMRTSYVSNFQQQQQQPVQTGYPGSYPMVKGYGLSSPDLDPAAYSSNSAAAANVQQQSATYGRPPYYAGPQLNAYNVVVGTDTSGNAENLNRLEHQQTSGIAAASVSTASNTAGGNNIGGMPTPYVRSQEISPNSVYVQQQAYFYQSQQQPMIYQQQNSAENNPTNQQQAYNPQMVGNVPKNNDPGGARWSSHHFSTAGSGKYSTLSNQILPMNNNLSSSSSSSGQNRDTRHCVLERVNQPIPFVNAREISMTVKQQPAMSPAQPIRRELSLCFPKNCVEATVPCVKRRKKIFAKELGKIDNQRILMALKSDLWYETAWALNILTVLLYDDTTAPCFLLSSLPSLLPVLVDLYERLLCELFPFIRNNASTMVVENENDSVTYLTKKYDGLRENVDSTTTMKAELSTDPEFKHGSSCASSDFTTISRRRKRVKFCTTLSAGPPDSDEESFSDSNGNNYSDPCGNNNYPRRKRAKLDHIFMDQNILDSTKRENSSEKVKCSNKASFFYTPAETVAEDSDEIMQISSNLFTPTLLERCSRTVEGGYRRNRDIVERLKSVSNVLRGLSNVADNEPMMAKSDQLICLLSDVLLLGHHHVTRRSGIRVDYKNTESIDNVEKNTLARDNENKNSDSSESRDFLSTCCCDPLTLATLIDDAFVLLCQVSSHLDLQPMDESASAPLLDALLHWSTCKAPSSRDPCSYWSHVPPDRYALEILCKLSINEQNVDVILATPPLYRLEALIGRLAEYLGVNDETETVIREFAIVLIQTFCCADQVACVVAALRTPSIAYLLSFLEIADMEMHKVVQRCSMQALRDNPEVIGTSVGMLRRAANTLLAMSKVEACRPKLQYHQQKLLNFTMSHLMDSRVGATIADVLYEIQKHHHATNRTTTDHVTATENAQEDIVDDSDDSSSSKIDQSDETTAPASLINENSDNQVIANAASDKDIVESNSDIIVDNTKTDQSDETTPVLVIDDQAATTVSDKDTSATDSDIMAATDSDIVDTSSKTDQSRDTSESSFSNNNNNVDNETGSCVVEEKNDATVVEDDSSSSRDVDEKARTSLDDSEVT